MRGGGSLLLIGDGSSEIAAAMHTMSDVCCKIVVARDGDEALDYLSGANELPRAVFLDFELCTEEGMKVLRRIRADERSGSVPVALFSSSAKREDVKEAYDLGANAYIPRPSDPTLFATTVHKTARYWLVFNTPPRSWKWKN